jgi:hypothetical protein
MTESEGSRALRGGSRQRLRRGVDVRAGACARGACVCHVVGGARAAAPDHQLQ